ncbi:MAG: tRNA (N6-threonylcarbamoyladenosine(37)-N6)-methyltransferase TrmO [Lachnospiraceae bacterium]|nr:tRNA (N6-threonylcarbamoyladenosine(37)-N6)-methyltransferase TrmO [Lachnospiraceae bacterium]
MEQKNEWKIIAHIRTDFPEKFGVPRQSGLVKELIGRIVFEPEYRNVDALRGIEGYDYLWLIWKFEGVEREKWSPTVRPPRLGGETHMGVFATRSPFRPNPIGLSSVKLEDVELTAEGPVLVVSGIDLRDNTPIYDIKPYLPYVDSHPDARGGFAEQKADYALEVVFPEALLEKIPLQKRQAIKEVLKQDPRPAYHEDAKRQYGMAFAGFNVRFCVSDGVLTVLEVETR